MTTITRELIAAYLNGEVKTLTNSEQKELARIALASLEADSDSSIHPAHGPVSLDRLHRIREILGKAAAQRDGGNIGYAMSDAVKAIDELLEVRKEEPDYYVVVTSAGVWQSFCKTRAEAEFIVSKPFNPGYSVLEIYTAPPAPVFPETLPCSVELKPGLIIGKGCKTETLLTALQRRADYYAEIDAMTPEERAEHEANIEAFKAMLPQPVPVVPDEIRNKLKAEGLAELLKDARDYAPLTSERWETLANNWHQTFVGLSGENDTCRAAMLNGGKS